MLCGIDVNSLLIILCHYDVKSISRSQSENIHTRVDMAEYKHICIIKTNTWLTPTVNDNFNMIP